MGILLRFRWGWIPDVFYENLDDETYGKAPAILERKTRS